MIHPGSEPLTDSPLIHHADSPAGESAEPDSTLRCVSPGNHDLVVGAHRFLTYVEVSVAGHRRGTGRPTRAQSRAERARRLLVQRMAQAQTPAERLGIAYGYARARLLELAPAEAASRADELVRVLTGWPR